MAWTKRRPSKKGWYWFREAENHVPIVVEIKRSRIGEQSALCMFYRVDDPEETGVVVVDAVTGEWLGPIEPLSQLRLEFGEEGGPSAHTPVAVRAKRPPEEAALSLTDQMGNGSIDQMKEILGWFASVGAEHIPFEAHEKYLVELANMLAQSFRMPRRFSTASEVVGFLMNA